MTTSSPDLGAFPDVVIVLAGGRGRRLGGVDKGSLVVGSDTLLQRVMTAAAARPVVLVGGESATSLAATAGTETADTGTASRPGPQPRVIATSEDPPGGGPAAGLAAGLVAWTNAASGEHGERSKHSEHQANDQQSDVGVLIAVVAVDYPGVTATTLARLAQAVPNDRQSGAALLADHRVQYGVGVFPLHALQRSAGSRETWHGAPLRDLVGPIIGVHVPASAAEAHDVDTPADLDWWQQRYRHHHQR